MMITDQLIERLAESGTPVCRLAPPWLRTVRWAALALPYVALVALVVSVRQDIAAKLHDIRFLIELSAAFATGIAAAFAAFATAVPGRPYRIAILPLIPLFIWLATVGDGCVRDIFGATGPSLRPDWFCFPATLLVGAIPAIAIALMLRQAATVAPHLTSALGGLAAAGLGNFGLRLVHDQDASLMVLIWQIGAVFVLAAMATLAGRWLLDSQSITGTTRLPAALAAGLPSSWRRT